MIAEEHSATVAQIALAWVLRERDIIAIPKASQQHVRANREATVIQLTKEDPCEN